MLNGMISKVPERFSFVTEEKRKQITASKVGGIANMRPTTKRAKMWNVCRQCSYKIWCVDGRVSKEAIHNTPATAQVSRNSDRTIRTLDKQC